VAMIRETTLDEFQTAVATQTTPLLVYFTSETCGPCRRLTPVLERVVGALDEQIDIVSLDVADSVPLVDALHIVRTPSLVLINERRVVASIAGFRRENDLHDALTRALTLHDGEDLPDVRPVPQSPVMVAERVLRLPEESVGQLRWVDSDQSVHQTPAEGTVTVPSGAHLQFMPTGTDLGLVAGLPLDGLFLAEEVDAAGLAVVASLTGLSELDISTGDLDTGALGALTGLHRLRIRCRSLMPLPALRELVVNSACLTDIDAVLAATGLRALRLDCPRLDGGRLARLTALPELSLLSLGIPLADSDIPWLAAMPALVTLDLHGEQDVTEHGMDRLREARPGLRLNGTWFAPR
jgi:thioredoxin 1